MVKVHTYVHVALALEDFFQILTQGLEVRLPLSTGDLFSQIYECDLKHCME